jgi:glycosyltransferase involved in cell wall biosynthesis
VAEHRKPLHIIEVAHVDFALDQFVRPLMLAIAARGHRVTGVCADGPLLARAREAGLRVETLPIARRGLNPFTHLGTLVRLVRLFRRERPDIVHAHFPVSGLLARVAARIAGVPRVAYTCHGFRFRSLSNPWLARGVFAAEWLAGRMTDLFLTVSETDAAIARARGIHAGAIAIGNGVDEAVFRPGTPEERADFRAELGLPEDAVLIAIASRLVLAKGFAELLESMRAVPGAVLLVAGAKLASDPDDGIEAVFAAAESDPVLAQRIRRLGYRTDLPRILGAADIFVLPSHYEALPVSIIEAMMAGLPVVATDIPGPREQVAEDATGLLVPVRDAARLGAALARLTQDGALRARMGAAARDSALARYRLSDVAGRTVAALEGIAAR